MVGKLQRALGRSSKKMLQRGAKTVKSQKRFGKITRKAYPLD